MKAEIIIAIVRISLYGFFVTKAFEESGFWTTAIIIGILIQLEAITFYLRRLNLLINEVGG